MEWLWKLIKVSCFSWLVIRKTCLTHESCKSVAHVPMYTWSQLDNAKNFFRHVETLEGMSRRRRSQEDGWKYILACIWWTIWKERNERSHDGQASSIRISR
ncbi:hypothetical protein H5410_045112 [Solanum commersonii]|uniref:Uncharacterized protein n=1 Tax=Solanum commersonii TaxID=4109 RepID=A0A9J5XBQ1_SOLCO|nr:hypothetical protein H5410_045112 [Solanum commersonii]